MGLFEDLKALGVDIDGGLKRLGGNEALYTRLLGTFVKAIRGQGIDPDFDTSDYEDVKEKAHAIKGMCFGALLCYRHVRRHGPGP